MAKFEITYKCGHPGIVQVYGPVAERDRKAEWLASKDCPECAEKKKAAANA